MAVAALVVWQLQPPLLTLHQLFQTIGPSIVAPVVGSICLPLEIAVGVAAG